MIRKLLIAGAALAGTVALVPSVAQAGNPDCNNNNVCIYDGNDFVGFIGERETGGGLENIRSAYNDKMDSWENNAGVDAAWYYDTNGNGNCHEMDSENENPNLGVFPSDELSSWRTDTGCPNN